MKYTESNKTIMLSLLFGVFFVFATATSANAVLSQEDISNTRKQLTTNIINSDLASGYAHVLTFFIEPDISASTYDVDDEYNTKLNIYKLPMQKTFKINEESWRLALRANVGYATIDNSQNILGDTFIDSRWKALSGSVGTGLIVPVLDNFAVITALDLGLSHMTNKGGYSGTFSGTASSIFDGILFNWDTDAWLGSLVFGCDYARLFREVYDLNVKGRYTYSHVSSFNESGSFPAFKGNAQTISLAVELKHPLAFSLAQFPVSGIAHLGDTLFVGDNRKALGFDSFFDLGYSLEIDISDMGFFVNSLRIGYQWNTGSDVEGHTVLFSLDFTVF